jgi:hypothetical protein
MVDLETLGSRAGCVILSIGAVYFDPVSGHLGDEFYTPIKIANQTKHGLTIDPATVCWWMKQSEAARSVFAECDDDKTPELVVVMRDFLDWVKARADKKTIVWSHGGNFDWPILEAALHVFDWKMPSPFWNSRCTRTLYEQAGIKRNDLDNHRRGPKHNALEDAWAQASLVCECYQRMGRNSQRAA